MVFFTGKKEFKNNYMHNNFSNQLERDTALDSLQIWEQCSPGSFTETSRDTLISSRRIRLEGMLRAEGDLESSANKGSR